jgi:putative ABC transport system permease protein
MRDLLDCALRELRRRKARTLSTVLGYLLAAGIVAVLVSGLVFARQAAGKILTTTGTHFIAFAPASRAACPGCAIPEAEDAAEGFEANGVATGLVPAALVERIRELPTVRDASPYLRFRFRDAAGGLAFTVGGFDPGNEVAVGTTCCAATDVVEGRFLEPGDEGAVMLEEAYARLRGLGVDDRVMVAGEAFRVVGVVNPGIRPAKADVYMHLAEARRAINRRLGARPIGEDVNVVLVEVASSTVQEQAMASVKGLLPGLLVSSYACYKPAAAVMGINERALGVLAAVICIGALALAMKTQLASVIERRHDIAVLKAIGWSDGNVVAQILTESLLVAAAGGLLGCLAAVVLLTVAPLEVLSGIPRPEGFGVSAAVLGVGLVLAIAGGAVAGIVPALLAARQRPAEALRHP